MELSLEDFWRLASESGLASADTLHQARSTFENQTRSKTHSPASPAGAARFLIRAGHLTHYQARVLMAGRSGPFRFGPYLVIDRHETGPLAGVTRATRPDLPGAVLLVAKTWPRREREAASEDWKRVAEAWRRASADSPMLGRVFDLGVEGKWSYAIFEELPGRTLAEALQSEPAFLQGRACRVAQQVAVTLAALHDQGLSHGEVLPHAIWIDPNDGAKLLCPLLFASASSEQADARRAAIAAAYPKDSEISPRDDLYALGKLLTRMLAGERSGAGSLEGDSHRPLDSAESTNVERLKTRVSEPVRKLLSHMLSSDPEMRFRKANRLAEALLPSADPAPAPFATPDHAALETFFRTGVEAPSSIAAPLATPSATREPVAPASQLATGAPPAQAVVPTALAAPPRTANPVSSPSPTPAALAAATASPPLIAASGSSTLASSRIRASGGISRSMVGLSVGVLVIAMGALAAFFKFNSPSDEIEDDPRIAEETRGSDHPLIETGAESTEPATVADSVQGLDEPMWESPQVSGPLALGWLPPGARAVVALRPSRIARHPAGASLLDDRLLGDVATWLSRDLPAMIGTRFENLDQVVVGFLDGESASERFAWVFRVHEPVSTKDLLASWHDPRAELTNGETIYRKDGLAYAVPSSGKGHVIVITPEPLIQETMELAGEPPATRAEVESVWRKSDDSSELLVLGAPDFLVVKGKFLFTGPSARLLEPLLRFLEGTDAEERPRPAKAALFRVRLLDELFLEYRVFNDFAGRPTSDLAKTYRSRVDRFAPQLREFVADLYLSDYSRKTLWNFPDWARLLAKYTRVGVDDEQVVLRAWLPATATDDLALGLRLCLLEQPGSGARSPTATPAKKQTVAERMKKRISLAFNRNPLDKAVELISADIEVPIEMLGNDLREFGITQNLSLSNIDERDQPADEILRKIMLKARPDGKLIYVVKPKNPGEEEMIFLTTPTAAAKRGDTIPPEFAESK